MPVKPEVEPLETLPWDSAFFGLAIGRATSSSFDGLAASHLQEALREGSFDCVYALIDGSDAQSAHALESVGFRFVDLRMTLATRPRSLAVDADGTSPSNRAAGAVRLATAADRAALAAIARVAHRDTRFYFDGNFAVDRCGDLYETWLENSFGPLADVVWVAAKDGMPVGYVTCAVRESDAPGRPGLVGTIGLIAVSASAQGMGLGAALVSRAHAYCRERGASSMRVVTQGRNAAAQRLYQRAGFVTVQTQSWYHAWPKLA